VVISVVRAKEHYKLEQLKLLNYGPIEALQELQFVPSQLSRLTRLCFCLAVISKVELTHHPSLERCQKTKRCDWLALHSTSWIKQSTLYNCIHAHSFD